jgi:hypothetical protein
MTFLRYAMLPAPARIAAAPSPKSRASWYPAVPPPPVGGAAAGNELADGLADGLAEGLALGVLTLAVPLGRTVGVAEALLAGENVVGVAEGEDPVQAETDAEARMVRVAQLAAVNLALTPAPAMVVRIFMRPPHPSCPESAETHKGNAHGRHRHVMACSPLEYQATRVELAGEDEGRGDGIGGG